MCRCKLSPESPPGPREEAPPVTEGAHVYIIRISVWSLLIWVEVLSLGRRGTGTVSDERILGSGDFVTRLFLEAGEREKETLRPRKSIPEKD
jgi:hypothetical protein